VHTTGSNGDEAGVIGDDGMCRAGVDSPTMLHAAPCAVAASGHAGGGGLGKGPLAAVRG